MDEIKYFEYKDLLSPPVKRVAYSDRTAWLMAEMSKLAYIKFEKDQKELTKILSGIDFELVSIFNAMGTQAFLAKRISDKMAVLSFRGTEVKSLKDILTDLDAKFYKNENGSKIHDGFFKAFELVKQNVINEVKKIEDFAVYITGHSLGGALALIATQILNSDNLSACYTFGSPKVGDEGFDDKIKVPIYRVVNAYDPVPFIPPSYTIKVLSLFPCKWADSLNKNFYGYTHHGDIRFLTNCEDSKDVELKSTYSELRRLTELFINHKNFINHHSIEKYCDKLAQWALKRMS